MSFLKQVNHYLSAVEVLKKIYRVENFRAKLRLKPRSNDRNVSIIIHRNIVHFFFFFFFLLRAFGHNVVTCWDMVFLAQVLTWSNLIWSDDQRGRKQGGQRQIFNLNCGERYEPMIDHRSDTHNLSSCEIRPDCLFLFCFFLQFQALTSFLFLLNQSCLQCCDKLLMRLFTSFKKICETNIDRNKLSQPIEAKAR